MREDFVQGGLMTVASAFGANDLLLDSLEGSQALSTLYSFTLTMRSASISLDAASVVGRDMTVTIAGAVPRYLGGIVTRFIQSGQDRDFAVYEAQLAPKLWLLNLSTDRKIYANQGVDAVVKSVLGRFGVVFESRLAASYAAVDYCVQYDETAFDFISRLMEQAGIFYFFTFAAGGQTMVLADASSQCADCAGAAAVRFWPDNGMHRAAGTVARFAYEQRIATQKATVNDYDFVTPDTTLEGSYAAATGAGATYDFATGHLTVDGARALAQLQVEAAQVSATILRGDSYCTPFAAGTKFTLSEHFVPALNAGFILRRVHHSVRNDVYSNSFDAFPATAPFRAPRLTARPRIAGVETARVMGPSGEEIWTDQYGRIKVRFPWDRDALDDKNAPWIRVAQATAGKGVGALFLPRVGHEVVISYLNGDPDRPLVTGSVFNGTNVTPAALPANQTQSIMRTISSKEGSARNELRFEDKKGAEHLYMHAQKDMLVEIENDHATSVIAGNRTIDVKKGNETHTVAGKRDVAVTGAEKHVNSADFTQTVTGNYALTVDGDFTVTVKGAINIVGSSTMLFDATGALTAKSAADVLVDATMNLTGRSGQSLTLQGGLKIDARAPVISSRADATNTVEAGAMLTLKGATAKVN
ncbi:MAG: type VI secretion system tip protein VgrG [Pseudomonadota bacterium]|nr:type VI secretion system tip protein VgrG [Pseudomonadota bacterium]